MTTPLTRSILAATDLTDACDEVVRAAAALARRTGAALHVIHSFDFPPAPYLQREEDVVGFQARVDDAEAALHAQLVRLAPDVPAASARVEIYAAHRAIVEYARAVEAELIVLGPHTRRELEIPFLGTTADRVVRTSPVPCLIVRSRLNLPLRRVVVPVDLSEPGRGALDVALAWGTAFGAHDAATPLPDTELEIMHVVPRAPGARLPFDRAQVLPGVNREVDDAIRRAGGTADLEVREEVRWADRPADEILRFAEERAADLVVLGTHGYGALKRALIGSVAAAVARGAQQPVLLVPPLRLPAEVEPLHEAEVLDQLPALAR